MPLYLWGVVYVANGHLWAIDALTREILAISRHLDELTIYSVPQARDGKDVIAYRAIR